jgi:small subunit ribosomal protein S4
MSANNITFILHKPQLSENIGACARGMKNFNFQKLSVIDPKPIFPNDKILATSVGAKNIINKSKVFDNIEPALKNIDYVIATSARFRNKNIKHIQLEDLKKIDFTKKVAFLFGSEASGLSNNEVSYANYTLQIPTNPDFKSLNLSHSLKVNLWGRPKSPFNTRAYGPGQHGQSRQGKPSDYGIQLQAKQKLKAYYGNINERQFRNIYKKAVMLKGDTSENLIGLLERRLDAVIYRAKFATTIFSARQLINHGHVRVNGKKVNIGSYLVKEEDTIEIRDKSKQLAIIDIALANKEREAPEYIQMDEKNKKVKFVRTPKFEEVPYPIVMEPNLVIEYYSR